MYLETLISAVAQNPKKRSEAFDKVYSTNLVGHELFPIPPNMTAADWKQVSSSLRCPCAEMLTRLLQSLKRWFDNHRHATHKNKLGPATPATPNRDTKPVIPAMTSAISSTPVISSERASVGVTPFTSEATAGTVSWAKLRDIAKFFTDITNSNMEVMSGRGVFAAEKNVEESAIADEWKSLSVTEHNKWEQRAATACDVEE